MRIPDKRGDAKYFDELAEAFSRIGNVQTARANPMTASIVLEFSGAWQDLLQQFQARDLPRIDGMALNGGQSARPVRQIHAINLVSGREIDPAFMAGAALGAAGLFQTIRGQIFVPAITFFWYAAQAFRKSGKSDKADFSD